MSDRKEWIKAHPLNGAGHCVRGLRGPSGLSASLWTPCPHVVTPESVFEGTGATDVSEQRPSENHVRWLVFLFKSTVRTAEHKRKTN